MKTVTIDILNNKAIKLLHDLEQLKLIRVRKQESPNSSDINWTEKYKGAMTKQPLDKVDNQLNELRNEWHRIFVGYQYGYLLSAATISGQR